MEPFGLLQLLDALLPKANKTEEPHSPTPPSQTPDFPEPTKTDPPVEEKPNACADFFERHNRRAQKNRR